MHKEDEASSTPETSAQISPRINKQRLFDPFDTSMLLKPPRPASATPSSSQFTHPSRRSPRRYGMKMLLNNPSVLYVDQQRERHQHREPHQHQHQQHDHQQKPQQPKQQQKQILPPPTPPTTSKVSFTDLRKLPQYQLRGLRKQTLDPPNHFEKKHNYFSYNKETQLWIIIIFPPKIPTGRTDILSIENWLNMTCKNYFNLKLRRSSWEAISDVRFFHLCALNAIANQMDQSRSSKERGSHASSHAKVIRNICQHLYKLDASDLAPHQKEKDCEEVIRTETSSKNSGVLWREEWMQEGLLPSHGLSSPDVASDIVLKQSQIMADLREELRYEKSLRARAEAKLAKVEGTVKGNV